MPNLCNLSSSSFAETGRKSCAVISPTSRSFLTTRKESIFFSRINVKASRDGVSGTMVKRFRFITARTTISFLLFALRGEKVGQEGPPTSLSRRVLKRANLFLLHPHDQNRAGRVMRHAVGNRTEPRALPESFAVRARDN
jgi:hypothetical protein